MLGVKRMPRPLSESRKPESRRKTAVLRGMRLRRIDSPPPSPDSPAHRGRGGTRRASDGWVRVLHPAADDVEERLTLFDRHGADRTIERRRQGGRVLDPLAIAAGRGAD